MFTTKTLALTYLLTRHQAWGQQCVAHDGAAGQTLKAVTLSLDRMMHRRRA